MYQEFIIQTVETDIINKRIVVTANMDIDANSIDEIQATFQHRETKEQIILIPEIKGTVLYLNLSRWPKLNEAYILALDPLQNVLKEKTKSGIKRKIEFKSSITKQVKIINPSMHEAVNDLNIKFETFDKTELENDIKNENVYIEVSSDNSFINVVNNISVSDRNEVRLFLDESNQYFLRARVQSDDEVGNWSEIISFIYGKKKVEEIQESEPDYIPEYEDMVDDMTPEIDDIGEFKVECLNDPLQTPESLILMGNKPFDEDDFESSKIMIYNKKGIVKHSAVVMDNIITIEFSSPLQDNSVYILKATNLKSTFGDTISLDIKIPTATKPLYCEIYDVTALIGEFNVPDDVIIHHIHEASKFADYIASCSDYSYTIDEDNVPFFVKQFVKYYAAHECLLRHTVNISSTIGLKGQVGNVNFSESESVKDISSLLKHFCNEIDKWKDSIRGFELEGRARMRTAIRGVNASPATQPMGMNSVPTFGRGDLYGN